MKKIIIFLFLLFSFPIFVQASSDNTNLGIDFNEATTTSSSEEIIIKPSPPIIKHNGNLPQLGQMIGSIILMLFGVSFIVVFLGIIVLKEIYYI